MLTVRTQRHGLSNRTGNLTPQLCGPDAAVWAGWTANKSRPSTRSWAASLEGRSAGVGESALSASGLQVSDVDGAPVSGSGATVPPTVKVVEYHKSQEQGDDEIPLTRENQRSQDQ